MRAPVAFPLLAALLLCSAPVLAADPAPAKQSAESKKSKSNFLTADNDLGAAALGEVGLTLGAMALAGNPEWRGYPRGDEGIPFANDTGAAMPFGGDGCAAKEGSDLAKALMAQDGKPATPPPPAPEGVLRLSETERQTAAKAYDSKAMYQGGAGCGAN